MQNSTPETDALSRPGRIERRRARRRFAPLRAIIGGERYRVLDWSKNGFAISGWNGGALGTGQPVDLILAIPLSGPKGRTRLTVHVTRHDPQKNVVAFAFGSIDNTTFEILTRYAQD